MREALACSLPLLLRLHRNHLYIEANVFEAHFANVQSVALLRKEKDLLILPLATGESGGFYIKQVNARGDRAIHAADFFRLNGIDENNVQELAAWPAPLMAGFVIKGLFQSES